LRGVKAKADVSIAQSSWAVPFVAGMVSLEVKVVAISSVCEEAIAISNRKRFI
jgi:hypothetical protein